MAACRCSGGVRGLDEAQQTDRTSKQALGSGPRAGRRKILCSGSEPPDPEYDGDIKATFVGVREEDGRRLGAIELTIDVLATVDLSEVADGLSEAPDDAPPGMVMPEIVSMEEERQYAGEGLMLWDLDVGRLHSLAIECDVRRTQTMTMILAMGGDEKEIEQVMVLGGTESWEVRFDG